MLHIRIFWGLGWEVYCFRVAEWGRCVVVCVCVCGGGGGGGGEEGLISTAY